MDEIIPKIIKKLDKYLEEQNKLYQVETEDYITNSGNSTQFLYERMLSVLSNNYIALGLMEEQNVNLLLNVSEFPIVINYKEDIKEYLKKEVDYHGKTPNWNKCFVDGYFKINNDGIINHLFVEYKINDKFNYSDLAKDFLKYKLYTYNCNVVTNFCYIIFDGTKDYPCILSTKKEICILDKVISKGQDFESNVFFYKSDKSSISEESYKRLPQLVDYTEEFSKRSNNLTKMNLNDLSTISEKEKELLDLLPKFNSRVIKSKMIKNNYMFIDDLWNKCQGIYSFKTFIEKLNNIDTAIQEIKINCSDIVNLEQSLSDENRILAENNGIRGSSFASLNLLALLEFFAKKNSIDYLFIDYGSKEVRKGKSNKIIDYRETANNRIDQLKEKIKSGELSIEVLNSMAICILFFITFVYNIFYEIDENKKITKEKEISKLYKLIEELQEICNKITNLVGLSKIKLKEIFEKNDSNIILNNSLQKLFMVLYDEYK